MPQINLRIKVTRTCRVDDELTFSSLDIVVSRRTAGILVHSVGREKIIYLTVSEPCLHNFASLALFWLIFNVLPYKAFIRVRLAVLVLSSVIFCSFIDFLKSMP